MFYFVAEYIILLKDATAITEYHEKVYMVYSNTEVGGHVKVTYTWMAGRKVSQHNIALHFPCQLAFFPAKKSPRKTQTLKIFLHIFHSTTQT